jgi:WD40 repeat protein
VVVTDVVMVMAMAS